MAIQIPLNEVSKRGLPTRWLSMVVITAIVASVVAWRLLNAESASNESTYKKIPFFFTHPSRTFQAPTDKRTVKVVITSQGALGLGCAYVYNYWPKTGYHEIYRGCEAVPWWKDVDVEWLDGGLINFTYTEPTFGPKTVQLYVATEPE